MKNIEKTNPLISILLRVQAGLTNPTEAIKKSLNNVHHKGLFSLVVDGEENGKLLRVFIAEKKIKPFSVQFHSHRYGINLLAINGEVKQHVAEPGHEILMPVYSYKSFLNGGDGLNFERTGVFNLKEFLLPKGSLLPMIDKDIHTVSCSKGSIWIVEELGFASDESTVLGVPFNVDGLYTEPSMFQINDRAQTVLKYVNQMLKDFSL